MSHIYTFYIAPASVIPPLILGFRRVNKLSFNYRFLLGYLGLSLVTSILMRVFAYVFHNNMIITRCYTVVEFPVLAGFYYWTSNSSIMRQIIKILVVSFAIFSISMLFVYYKSVEFDDFTSSLESLLVIFLGVSFIFGDHGSASKSKSWASRPVNWFNTGILLYFSGSLFIFLLTNYIIAESVYMYSSIWKVHATLFIGLNSLFSVGFLKIGNSSEQSDDFNI